MKLQQIDNGLLKAARFLTVLLPCLLVLGRAGADVSLTLAGIMFLVHCGLARDWTWLRRPWVIVALILWFWLMFCSALGLDPKGSLTASTEWIRFILLAAAVEHWIADRKWLKYLTLVAAATLGFVAVDCVIQFTTGTDLLGFPKANPKRLTGPFSHPEVGVFMARLLFPMLLGLWAWVSAGKGRGADRGQTAVTDGFSASGDAVRGRKFLVFALGILVYTAIFMSGERAAFILSSVAFLMVFAIRGSWKISLGLAALLVVTSAVLLTTQSTIVKRQFDSTASTLSHFAESPYGEIWHSGLHLVSERPLTGIGAQAFRVGCQDNKLGFPPTTPNRCALHPHNTYIQWAVDAGIPGLLLFLTLLGLWFVSYVRSCLRSGSIGWCLGPALGLFIYFWPLSPSGGFFSNWNAATVWLVIAWGLAGMRLFGESGDSIAATGIGTETQSTVQNLS